MSKTEKNRFFNRYYLLTYLVVLFNTFSFIAKNSFSSVMPAFFSLSSYLVYGLAYILPGIVLIGMVDLIFRVLKLKPKIAFGLLSVLSIIVFSLTNIALFADKFIFNMYGFHLNGFVWNIVFTKGGLESLGASPASLVIFTLFGVGFVVLQIIAFAVALKFRNVMSFRRPVLVKSAVFVVIAILALSQAFIYGLSNFQAYTPVLTASKKIPLYQPVTFKGWCEEFGLEAARKQDFEFEFEESSELNYPASPIVRSDDHKKYNIVWLVAESLRADMLDEEIMPASWDFAQDSLHFTHHYSGGNGTRMGLFSMFYGLYGNYWFRFLDEQRPPIFFDLLQQDNYQMELYTSARFSYPEFDKTVFSSVGSDHLHEYCEGAGWQRDRKNVQDIIDFIDNRDQSRPFMTFMFFESPHARYYFPEESVIREDYLEDFNYATVDLEDNIDRIKNRYINSCHHLDSQIDRLLTHLKTANLLDSTIVIITGDHGEEFMEKGHWGHNSEFTQEQVRTPLVMWIPGQGHQEIDNMTSHMDIAATMVGLLGVENPVSDYSLGKNLLGNLERAFVVVSDWSTIGYIGKDYKAKFPVRSTGFRDYDVKTASDSPYHDDEQFFMSRKQNLVQMLRNMSCFLKTSKI